MDRPGVSAGNPMVKSLRAAATGRIDTQSDWHGAGEAGTVAASRSIQQSGACTKCPSSAGAASMDWYSVETGPESSASIAEAV